MTEEFKSRVKGYDKPLFYNSKGSTQAYKLCIRHLSAALNAGVAELSKGYMIPKDVLYLVDLEEERIDAVSSPIKLIKLESLV